MAEFLLTVWEKGDTKNAGHEQTKGKPISLWSLNPTTLEIAGDAVAHHDTGVDVSEIDCSSFIDQGSNQAFTTETAFSQSGLSNDALIQMIGNELWSRLALDSDGLLNPVGFEIKKLLSTDCRIYLDLKSDLLRSLPWELIRADDLNLFSLEDTCWLIGRPEVSDVAGNKPPVVWEVPMRIMVVIGNSPTDKKLNSERELELIEFYAHNKNSEVLLNVMTRPSVLALEEEFEQFKPHVFHFIGHGGFDSSTSPKPILNVYDAKRNQNDPLNVEKLKKLARKSPPRVVLLNACLTARNKFLTAEETKSLADAFLDSGCPAVLAMRGEIRDDSSLNFSKGFYKHFLEEGMTVERAVSAARNQLKDFANVASTADQNGIRSNWPLPRLTVYGNVNEITKLPKSAPQIKEGCKPCPDFVDRWSYRWKTLQTIDPKRSRLVVLYGSRPTGKSELLRTLTAISVQKGAQALVVNCEGPTSGTWQDLLGFILAEAAELGIDTDSLEAIDLSKETGNSKDSVPKFLAELEKALKAKQKETVLVVDGISHWKKEILENDIYKYLCKPFVAADTAEDEKSFLRMMIAIREKPNDNTWGVFPDGWKPIEVGEFNKANGEWERALRQMELYWENQIEIKTNDPAKVEKFTNHAAATKDLGGDDQETLEMIRYAAKVVGGFE